MFIPLFIILTNVVTSLEAGPRKRLKFSLEVNLKKHKKLTDCTNDTG